MSRPPSMPARTLAWWRLHVSLQFGVTCLAAKIGTELLGLDWHGLDGFVHATSPAMDLLTFFPACVILFDLADRLRGGLRAAALGAVVLAVTAAIVADLLALAFFHESLATILPVLVRTHAISATGANRLDLIPGPVLALAAAFAAGAFIAFGLRRRESRGLLGPSALLLAGSILAANRPSLVQASLNTVTHNELDYTDGASARLTDKPLHSVPHDSPEIRRDAPFEPKTIVVFINESLPWQFASSANPRRGLFDTILDESGLDRAGWHVFAKAFTNSSATDVSVPSILTGSDPTAGTDAAEALPFLYAMAGKRGYATGLFTSQDFAGIHLRDYFSNGQLDAFLSGEMTGQPAANLGGIDDMYIARKIAEYVKAKGPGEKLFLVLNNNALHIPYQIESLIKVPGYAQQAKERAAFIIEQFYAVVFRSLEETGRLKDSLIFITSDHGEAHPDRKRTIARLFSHYDEVINIPFAIHLPASAPADFGKRLEANRDRTVENIDIAPTLMDALGLGLPSNLRYPGCDLFQPVPEGRVSVSVTNNEWSEWRPIAFGVACGEDRLIFHQKLGLMYFDIRTDPGERNPITSGPKFDSYRAFVMVHPVLPKYLNTAGTD